MDSNNTNNITTSIHQHLKRDHVYYVSEEINLAVRLIPFLLHSFGLYLLHILRHRRKHHKLVHIKLIQHLSISELGLVFCSVVISTLLLLAVPRTTKDDSGTTTSKDNSGTADLSGYLRRNKIIIPELQRPANESIYVTVSPNITQTRNSSNFTINGNATSRNIETVDTSKSDGNTKTSFRHQLNKTRPSNLRQNTTKARNFTKDGSTTSKNNQLNNTTHLNDYKGNTSKDTCDRLGLVIPHSGKVTKNSNNKTNQNIKNSVNDTIKNSTSGPNNYTSFVLKRLSNSSNVNTTSPDNHTNSHQSNTTSDENITPNDQVELLHSDTHTNKTSKTINNDDHGNRTNKQNVNTQNSKNIQRDNQQRWDIVIYVLLILKNSGFSLVYYVVNILITLDRFLEMKLNIKYPQLVSNRSVNIVLTMVWLSGAIFAAIIMYFGKMYDDFDHVSFSYLYFFSTMELVFLFTALTTYTYILKEYVRMSSVFHNMPRKNQVDMLKTTKRRNSQKMTKKRIGISKRNKRKDGSDNDGYDTNNNVVDCSDNQKSNTQKGTLRENGPNDNNSKNNDEDNDNSNNTENYNIYNINNNNNNNNSNTSNSNKKNKLDEESARVTSYKVKTLFKKSSPLVMISLLVTSFVFFMMLPDILNVVYYIKHRNNKNAERQSWSLVLSTYILYTLAYTSDALIYIVLQKETRAILRRKFFRNIGRRNGLTESTLSKYSK